MLDLLIIVLGVWFVLETSYPTGLYGCFGELFHWQIVFMYVLLFLSL